MHVKGTKHWEQVKRHVWNTGTQVFHTSQFHVRRTWNLSVLYTSPLIFTIHLVAKSQSPHNSHISAMYPVHGQYHMCSTWISSFYCSKFMVSPLEWGEVLNTHLTEERGTGYFSPCGIFFKSNFIQTLQKFKWGELGPYNGKWSAWPDEGQTAVALMWLL